MRRYLREVFISTEDVCVTLLTQTYQDNTQEKIETSECLLVVNCHNFHSLTATSSDKVTV